MGTKMAPAYANLFMVELEEKLLANSPIDPYLWKRYIDDILCLWPGMPKSLKHFMDTINKAHPTIKFTYECSRSSVDFLDLTINKGSRFHARGKLDIKPFFKETNTINKSCLKCVKTVGLKIKQHCHLSYIGWGRYVVPAP
jgi:hypothetical protein